MFWKCVDVSGHRNGVSFKKRRLCGTLQKQSKPITGEKGRTLRGDVIEWEGTHNFSKGRATVGEKSGGGRKTPHEFEGEREWVHCPVFQFFLLVSFSFSFDLKGTKSGSGVEKG